MGIRLLIRVLFLGMLAFLFMPDESKDAAAAGAGKLMITLRYADGAPISTSVEIYKQAQDANGQPILGQYVTYGNTGQTGTASVDLEEGVYAIGRQGLPGYDWPERWNISVRAGQTTNFSYSMGRLKVTLRFGDGSLFKNQYITVHRQESDANGNPIAVDVFTYASTRDAGFAEFDLTAGTYAVNADSRLPGYEWPKRFNLVVESGKVNDFNYSMGRILVTPKAADGSLLKNITVYLAYLEKDASGKSVEGTKFHYNSTGNTGTAILDVTPGNYVMSYNIGSATTRRFGVPAFSATVTMSDGVNITGFQPSWQNPSVPSLQTLSGQNLSQMSVILNWTLSQGATQYQVQVTPANNDGPAIDLIRAPEQSFTVAAPKMGQGNYVLLPDMTYSWRVRASNASWPAYSGDVGWSPWSEFRTFRTPNATSDTITSVFPPDNAELAGRTAQLRWTNSNASIFYYEVQVSSDPTFGEGGPVAAVWHNLVHGGVLNPLNSWLTPGLQPNLRYYWRVRPRVQGDGSPVAWSQSWSFQTR